MMITVHRSPDTELSHVGPIETVDAVVVVVVVMMMVVVVVVELL